METKPHETVDITEFSNIRFHHHVKREDREMAIITGYTGPLITACGRAKESVGNPAEYPCCPDCASLLKNPCTASN